MQILITLFLLKFVLILQTHSECFQTSDISLYHPGFSLYDTGICIDDHTLMSSDMLKDFPYNGITCSKKNSTSTDGTWTYDNGGSSTVIDCNNNDVLPEVRCARQQPGSVTLYTLFNASGPWSEGKYTCCIEGLCRSIWLYQSETFNSSYQQPAYDNITQLLETCIIVPPSDITTIPQQYLVQMNTSGVAPFRLLSFINCTDGDGITCGQSYYTLIDLNEEKHQMTVPVTWSTDSTTNTDHVYSCTATRLSGMSDTISSIAKSTNIKASSAPSIVSYEVANATAINLSWSISGDVNGFIINITSDGLDTVTIQLTDDSLREYVINGLLPERDYTVEVRGYYGLLGPANTTTVRLKAGISSIVVELKSVDDVLNSISLYLECSTFRVEPSQVTWIIGGMSSSMHSSELLDNTNQTYRHTTMQTESFTAGGTTISCYTNVNGESISKDYILQVPSSPPTGLSATILSSTSLSISWTPLSDVNGYIIQYTGGQSVMVTGEDSSNTVLEGLTHGTTYQINIYSYSDLVSRKSNNLTVLLDAPAVVSLEVVSNDPISVLSSWILSPGSVVDNYTLSFVRLCDNITFPTITFNGNTMSTAISYLLNGYEHKFSLSVANTLGTGVIITNNVVVFETGPPSGAPYLRLPITIDSTTVILTWEEVNCSYSNGKITGYRVMYYIDGEVQQSTGSASSTSIVITGLMEFELYYVSVSAVNSIGAGPYSEQRKVYTINYAVIALSGNYSTSFAQLSWQPLPSIVDVSYQYEVVYGVIDSAECTGNSVSLPNEYTVYSPRTSNSTIKVLGLISGTCYVFGVRAYSSVSNLSGNFSVIIGATVSDAIIGLKILISYTIAQVSWNTIEHVPIDNYFYEVIIASSDSNCSSGLATPASIPQYYTSYANTTNGSIEVTGLKDDTCYVFGIRVHSQKHNGIGKWTVLLKKTKAKSGQAVDVTLLSTISVVSGLTILILLTIMCIFGILIIKRASGIKFNDTKRLNQIQKATSMTTMKASTAEMHLYDEVKNETAVNSSSAARYYESDDDDDGIKMSQCEPYQLVQHKDDDQLATTSDTDHMSTTSDIYG